MFKVKVKLDLNNENNLHFLSAQMPKYLMDKNVNSVELVKTTHKTSPESSLRKASFSGKFQNGRH